MQRIIHITTADETRRIIVEDGVGPRGPAGSSVIEAGSNITITGGGTEADPLVISATGEVSGSVAWSDITGIPASVSGTTASFTTALETLLGTAVQPAALASYVQTDDARLADARTPTAHASTHATAGSDPLTPANIGAATADHTHAQLHDRSHAMTGTSDHTATNWRVFYSNGSGQVAELALGADGTFLKSNGASAAPSFATISGGGDLLAANNLSDVANAATSLSNLGGASLTAANTFTGSAQTFEPGDATNSARVRILPINSGAHVQLYVGGIAIDSDTLDLSGVFSINDVQVPIDRQFFATTNRSDGNADIEAVVTESANFTLSQATHWRKWVRLTSETAQTITLPTGTEIDIGCQFAFFRATDQTLAFSGGTVAGASRLADVVQNSAFGLVYRGGGNYDFV